MPNLTIKNIPEDLYARLKEAAATNRRSINSEVILYIERNLGITKSSPEVIIARARTLREKIKGDPLTAEDIQEAKESGRL